MPYALVGTLATVFIVVGGAWMNVTTRITRVEEAVEFDKAVAREIRGDVEDLKAGISSIKVAIGKVEVLVEMQHP